jgi:hypothetical protein
MHTCSLTYMRSVVLTRLSTLCDVLQRRNKANPQPYLTFESTISQALTSVPLASQPCQVLSHKLGSD